jgi:3-oxoacyl-[acyl-carrier protein] reductase
MNNLLDLSGKIALVTGSSRGIGKELALELAEGGAKVAIHYLKSEELAEKTVEEIKLKGVEVIKVKSDIRYPERVEYLFEEIENKLGSVDILVNNVGDHAPKHWEDIDFETWERVMATNFTSTYLCSKRVLPKMREKAWGRIINIGYASSEKGLVNTKNFPYFVSKAGVQMFTRMLASDTSGSGITVNSLSPYVVENSDNFPEKIPMGRPAKLEEVAKSMLFFIGHGSEYISGANLEIHGGWLPERV